MLVRTPTDLGAIIRDRRKELKLNQAELAQRVGTSRQWIIGIEKGRARAELGLVLRTLEALGLRLDAAITSSSKGGPDIDAIIATARKGRK